MDEVSRAPAFCFLGRDGRAQVEEKHILRWQLMMRRRKRRKPIKMRLEQNTVGWKDEDEDINSPSDQEKGGKLRR